MSKENFQSEQLRDPLTPEEMVQLGVKEEDNAYSFEDLNGRRHFFMKILGASRLKKEISEKKKELGLN